MMMQQQVQAESQQREQAIQNELQKSMIAAQTASYEAQAESMLMQVQTTLADKMYDNQLNTEEYEHKKFVDIQKLDIEREKLSKQNG